MTPRHALPPDEHEQPLRKAAQLVILLAERHNIPATVETPPCGVVVRVFPGLITHVDHIIWWTIPDIAGTRDRPLRTYAHTAGGAADRVAKHYQDLRSIPIEELLASGCIRLLTGDSLDDVGARHAS
ncbi:hypothetical protein [Nonomuraea cavernae]|uniref:Uncharacterized protein n=1 Tax=Nonomuraea cavernae TaxID=2045107 RepID=A0A917YSQ6_9ACTN|nr:hypothetical protein [Nonomuraea cavernae]MCA2184617.1 hypothetical protein [Nonomuraea cavernae]GGO63253.1 hypothetical protein GCM10012289_09830 [Nonomuraea cavernae]